MVLIDSGVWIDYFSGLSTQAAETLDRMLREGGDVATTGVVVQEVLQGARSDRAFHLYRARLSHLPYLAARRSTHEAAASLYRKLRARGVTVPSVDTLIAAAALESGASMLTTDRAHFEAIAKASKLKLVA